MTSLLIDFDNIIKPNKLSLIENAIKPIPETSHSLGLVLIISQKQYNALEAIPKGNGRVQYLNSEQFVNSITGYAYLIYDKNKKVCEIMCIKGPVLSQTIDNALSSIPNNVTLWIGIDLDTPNMESVVQEYIKLGFHNPYICKTSPLGYVFTSYGLCMLKQNDIVDNNDAMNDVKYVFAQFMTEQQGHCVLKARLGEKAIQYLQKVSKIGSTINKSGDITQKELAGRMIAGIIDSDLTYHLEVDRSSIISGEEEGVEIIEGLYNFHSHPQEAYDRNNVHLGWPSAQDYIGFMASSLKYDTILHLVVSLEGFYVISLSNYWVNKKEELDKDVVTFILEKYNLLYEKGRTPAWYLRTVNEISYNGFPIFLVQFIPWYNSTASFIVPFRKNGVNCFAIQNTLEKYEKLYNIN
jgi:hypothetical protein